jgi:hypothetical protein
MLMPSLSNASATTAKKENILINQDRVENYERGTIGRFQAS